MRKQEPPVDSSAVMSLLTRLSLRLELALLLVDYAAVISLAALAPWRDMGYTYVANERCDCLRASAGGASLPLDERPAVPRLRGDSR
jgi:hypothetical protein